MKHANINQNEKLVMKHVIILFFICFGISIPSISQVYTNKEVGKKNVELIDSLKASDYPYSLPIWGEKATQAGYNLPYSAGISVQYFGSKT